MINISMKLRKLFENHHDDFDLPFFHSFPKSCCEEASLILGALLKDEYPFSNVKYANGLNQKGSSHFWIEADDLIFDITADQFDHIPAPFYGEKQQPLLIEFPETIKLPIIEALENSDRISKSYYSFIKDWFHHFCDSPL